MHRIHFALSVPLLVALASSCVVRDCPEPVYVQPGPPPPPPVDTPSAPPGDAPGTPGEAPDGQPSDPRAGQPPCVPGGCSGQLCIEQGQEAITTCEWRPEYACYRSATCERQPSGQCGWTPTPALQQCLANPPAP